MQLGRPVLPRRKAAPPTLFSAAGVLLASACALFSVDDLVRARYGELTHYRHDYSREDSAAIIEVIRGQPRTRSEAIIGPCVTTLRGRLKSRMLIIAHDGECVGVFTEILWYALGRLEVKAGLESPGEGKCP